MGVKNVKNCFKTGGNTGVGSCWNDIGIPRGLIKVPIGKIYSTASIPTLKAALEADILADNAQLRAYPVQGWEEITDNTKDPNEQTFSATGRVVVVGENDYDLLGQWYDGGYCLSNSLRKSKGQRMAFFFIDSFGQLIGADAGTDSNPEQITGIVAYNYTYPPKFSVSNSAVTAYRTRLVFRPEQIADTPAFIDFSNDGGLGYLQSLNGLFNVGITQAAARAAGVLTVKAQVIGCGSEDLYDLYAAQLAVPGAWQVKNASTGNALTVTAVAQVAADKAWQITVSITDPNYTATAGGLLIGLIGPTELAALTESVDATGYESNFLAQ